MASANSSAFMATILIRGPAPNSRFRCSVGLDPQRPDALALVLVILARALGERSAVQIDDGLIESLGRRLERLGLDGVFARALEHGDDLARRALRRVKAVEARRHRRHVELR